MLHASRARSAAIVLVLLVASACGGGDPSGPEPPDPPVPPTDLPTQRIETGDTVELQLEPTASGAAVTVQPDAAAELAFFVQALEGSVNFIFTDSASGAALGDGHIPTDAVEANLYRRRTPVVAAAGGQVLHLRLIRNGTTRSRVRLIAYEANPAPELLAPSIAPPDTISSETLENSADVDEFSFTAAAGDELIAFAHLAAGGSGVLELVIRGVGPDTIAAVNAGAGTELERFRTQRFVVPADGSYRVSVRAYPTDQFTQSLASGPYRLQLRRIDRAPESVPQLLAAGDTVAEAIDFEGDVDEFHVPVTAGAEYNVFLQTLAGDNTGLVAGSLIDDDGDFEHFSVASIGPAPTLLGQFSGNVTAPAGGTMTVRVMGLAQDFRINRGGYRLFVYPVNPAPELVGATLVSGSPVVETIELPGDVDTFILPNGPTGVSHLKLERTASSRLLNVTGEGVAIQCYSAACGSTRIFHSSDRAIVVRGDNVRENAFQGSYGLTMTAIDTMPEGRAAAFALGEVVAGEVSPVGDLDVYTFSYTEGRLLSVTHSVPHEGIGIGIAAPGLFGLPPHFTLSAPGIYRVNVSGTSSGAAFDQVGPYSFSIIETPVTAEGGATAVGPGDSLTSEAIDFVGDVDEILLSAAVGTEVQVRVRNAFPVTIEVLQPGSLIPIVSTGTHSTGRMVVPGGGPLRLRVREPFRLNLPTSLSFTGEYDVVAYAIDRDPESVSPAISLGVNVDGERIDPVGDIDDFTFAGTAGQRIIASISAPMGFEDISRVAVEVIDPSDGTVLGTADSNDGEVESTGEIVLPGTRSYAVRVRGVSDTQGHGGYRVLLAAP